MEKEPNLYKLLMVDPEAEAELIRRAYEYLSAKYHPDNKTTGNKEKFDAVENAWKLLSDEKRRVDYDLTVLESSRDLREKLDQVYEKVRKMPDPAPETGVVRAIRSGVLEALVLYERLRRRPDSDLPSGPSECSFCGKKQEEVAKLIAGPGVYVCDFCVADLSKKVADPNFLGAPDAKCSFCGKRAQTVKKLISAPKARICDECIDLCNEILDEELS